MNNSSILFLAASLAAASLLAAGDDPCPGVPTEAADAACHGASTSSAMYDLCMGILSSSPPTAEVTAYAHVATVAAAKSCLATVDAGEQMSQNGSLNRALSDAWGDCWGNYNAARAAIAVARDKLERCAFVGIGQGYMDAMAAIDVCAAKLLPAGGISTPLYALVVGDRDRTVIALGLASPLAR
ncbi:hypothetical protein ACP70R_003511 [Stipagrostis hirtigluma subsp. patula]